jgi:DNA-binding GntR family transcriptional regulator
MSSSPPSDPALRERSGRDLPPGRIDRAYRVLREAIVHGRLAPGTRIVEVEVARRLGLSRTPVRSALQRLQQEGYVLAPGLGRQSRMTVAPLTERDIRELFGIVGQMEGLAARWSSELPAEEREPVVAALRALNQGLADAARQAQPDKEEIFMLDADFHHRYVEAGAGPRLGALHEAIKPQTERYVRLYISGLVDEIGTSVEEHEEIIEGIEMGSPLRAQRAVERNWSNAAIRLTRVVRRVGEQGEW